MSDWNRVQTIFLTTVDMPAAERHEYLRLSCMDDAELLAEIESLLAADQDSGHLIETVVQSEAAHLFDSQSLVGERLGIYRIVREIGRGGMGSVYLALRDDDEFRKEVALKIVKRGMDTAEVLERFRYERQILANLDHPYIARLFDGGTTASGVPFFVMEYIEGRPVDVFCREQTLGVNARCELFLRILEAVAYAHRSLVVHRDLKPANILITADGTPKLLDFGVAKLLNGDPGTLRTRTSVYRPFTPGYASPEQVRGEAITTATDVYSLGAILYELLIGKRAQLIELNTPAEIERVVCDTEVPRPSLQALGLYSDLGNIVLMAMRKEASRRYQSVDQFADDIRRYLEGRPVIARQDSIPYRFGKFIQRNSLQAAAIAMVSLSLVGGLVVSLNQTRRADRERDSAESQRQIALHQTALAESARLNELQQRNEALRQRAVADQQRTEADSQRDEAQHQRTLAEARVKDILLLANRTLFDVHDAVAKLPGSVAARRTLVDTTLDYLETLSHETGLDDQMREALCAAYYKVALIQGDAQGASLGDVKAAETSLLKAQTLLMPAYHRKPKDTGLMLRLIEVRASLADLMYRSGRQEPAIQMYLGLLPVAHRLAIANDCPLQCKMQEATIENSLTYEMLNISPSRALEHADRGIALTREMLVIYPNEPSLKQAMGSLMAGGAGAHRALGELDKASSYYRESIRAREELLAKDPVDAAVRRNLLIVYGNYATMLGVPWSPNLNRPDEARLYAGKSAAIARELVTADSENATARHDLGMCLSRLGMIDPDPAQVGIATSLANLQEARSLIEPLLAANPKSAETAAQISLILEFEGHRLEALNRPADATATYRRSISVVQSFFEVKNPAVVTQYISAEQSLALLEATGAVSASDRDAALPLARLALAQADSWSGPGPRTANRNVLYAQSLSIVAETEHRLRMSAEAHESAVAAMQIWNSMTNPGVLTAHRQNLADLRAILAAP